MQEKYASTKYLQRDKRTGESWFLTSQKYSFSVHLKFSVLLLIFFSVCVCRRIWKWPSTSPAFSQPDTNSTNRTRYVQSEFQGHTERPAEGHKTLRYQLSVIYFFNGYFNNLLKVIQKNPNKTYAIKDCVAFTELIVHDLGAFNKILICHIMCLFLCRPTHSPAPMRRRPTWTHRLSLVCWQAFVCFEVIWYSYLILPLVNIKGTRMEDRGGTQKRPQLATWSALPLREALNRPEYRHTD